MTVAFGAIGTGANGGATVAPSYPTGITVGQLLTCHVSSGATNSETPTTPSGWILLATGASTDGTFGVDTGPRRATVFARVADGSESGTLTISITNGNTARATIARWTSSIGSGWVLQALGGADSTSGTDYSANVGSINWATGDCALVVVGQRVDTVTQSAQSLTASGTTFGTRTNQASTAVTTGNDIRHVVDTFDPVTTGGGSAATTWAYTGSAATSGGVVVVRIREIGDVAESVSFTAAQTLTYIPAPQRANEALTGLAGHGSMLARRAALAEAVSQSYNRAVAESLTLADAQSEASTLPRQRGESIALSDAGSEASTLPRAVAESFGLTAAQTSNVNASLNRARDETLTLTAAQDKSAAFPKIRAEALTLTDSAYIPAERFVNQALVGLPGQGVARWVRAIGPGLALQGETLTLTAAQTESASLGVARAESLTLTDSQANLGRNSARQESLALTDAAAESASLNSGAAESFGLSSSSIGSLGAIKTRNETLTLTDAQTGLKAFSVQASDTLTLTAAQVISSFVLAAPRFNALLIGERRESLFQPWAMDAVISSTSTESITLTDARTASATRQKSSAETLSLSATMVESAQFARACAEAVAFTASASGSTAVVFVRQVSEALAFSDSQSRFSSIGVVRGESVSLSSAQAESANLFASEAEAFGLVDSPAASKQPIYNRARADAFALSTSQSASVNSQTFVGQVVESVGLSEAVSQIPSLNFSRTEVVTLNAAVESVAQFGRFLAESFGISESAYILTGPFSDAYRYDVPATSLRYDIPGEAGALGYDIPATAVAIGI